MNGRRRSRGEGKGRCKNCGTLLDNQKATFCPECKINRWQKAGVVLETLSDICQILSDSLKPEDSGTDDFVCNFEDNTDGEMASEMRCANCGNTNTNTLWDETDTIHCSLCHHRTSKKTGRDDVVECPYCHRMRDRKAMYCRHCNDATWQPSTKEEFAEIDRILKELGR